MDSNIGALGALGGLFFVILFVVAVVFLIMLFLAPIKLYSIHREIQQSNALLTQQNSILVEVNNSNQAQVRLLAAMANMTKDAAKSAGAS